MRLCAAAIGLYETAVANPDAFPGFKCQIDEEKLNLVLETLSKDDPQKYIDMLDAIYRARNNGWTIITADYLREHPELLDQYPELLKDFPELM